MKLKEIKSFLEGMAPLAVQESWDNSGLQIGCSDKDIHKVMVCLDLTEAVLDEAEAIGADLVISHHPLIFKGLKSISGSTYQERCVRKAILSDIAVYSAHTSLDNILGGVNHKIASLLGLSSLTWLDSGESAEGCDEKCGGATEEKCGGADAVARASGSGLIGELKEPVAAAEFLSTVKTIFSVKALKHSPLSSATTIRSVALCGGAGAFLLPQAVAKGADCFISGEFHYHDYFDPGTLLIELGHYESEQFTQDLLKESLERAFPGLEIVKTSVNTNPQEWLI
ncbi:MAG: Nif3-like dinuclear metal center hexameric protein [Bacteroidales bacterium]|nr:Nif3-like dinuclear metal center hexameric protein [Bacteroidales bacterium]